MPKNPRPLQAEMTQQEVADALGTTRQAVADIERKALRKLKVALSKRKLTLDDFFTWEKK